MGNYHGLKDTVAYYAPFSYMTKNIDETQHKNIVSTVRQIGKVKITGEDEFKLIKAQVKNSKYSNEMVSKPGTINDTFILSESDYKSIIKTTIVVSDEIYNSYLNKAAGDSIIKFNGFMFDNPMNSESTVTALNKFIPKSIDMPGVPNVSYIGMFRALFSSYGVFTFIGLFLGILFMLSTGSIMYYKQIIEAQEEKAKYNILRKTGMKKEEVKKSISKQLGIAFACPLLVGILHTFPCLIVNNHMSGVLGKKTPTLLNAIAMMAIFVIAYGFFYVISVRKYLRIVWNK